MDQTRGVIRCCIYQNRKHNGKKTKDKMTNNDLINITQKTKDQATRTQLKPGMNAGFVAG